MSTNSDRPDYVDPRFPGPDPYAALGDHPTFPLSSTDFNNGDKFGPGIVATEGNPGLSPQLSWSNLPEGTKSIAITCLDPDAPTGSGYWHWAVFNIPIEVNELPTGAGSTAALERISSVDGAEHIVTLKGDSGLRQYFGPMPPSGHGPHRYLFAVHAVDVETLDIDPDATPAVLGFNLYFHTLARSIAWGWYEND